MKLLNRVSESILTYSLLATLPILMTVSAPVLAVGVAAGSSIKNTVTVTYYKNNNTNELLTTKATNQFLVDETINATVTSLDSPSVVTPSPATDKVLSFLVTNTGNGNETFSLQTNDSVSNDDFNPTVQALWIETNNIPGLQSDDTQYQPGVNDLVLDSDQSSQIYIVSSIPAQLNQNSQGQVILTAMSMTPGVDTKNIGESVSGAGTNNSEAVLLIDKGSVSQSGTYSVSPVQLSINKSIIKVADSFSGETAIPDSLITYRIDIQATGTAGTLENVVITDPTPDHMTYVPGSIYLDGSNLSDTADLDKADFGQSKADSVTLNLGDITPPHSYSLTVTYKIN